MLAGSDHRRDTSPGSGLGKKGWGQANRPAGVDRPHRLLTTTGKLPDQRFTLQA
jgi:hypothetical protein